MNDREQLRAIYHPVYLRVSWVKEPVVFRVKILPKPLKIPLLGQTYYLFQKFLLEGLDKAIQLVFPAFGADDILFLQPFHVQVGVLLILDKILHLTLTVSLFLSAKKDRVYVWVEHTSWLLKLGSTIIIFHWIRRLQNTTLGIQQDTSTIS